MSRRPWIGLGLSLAFHAAVLALAVAAVWRDDSLPALIVDLREGFAPAVASIRTRVGEVRHGRRSGSPSLPPTREAPGSEGPERSTAVAAAPTQAAAPSAPAPTAAAPPSVPRLPALPAGPTAAPSPAVPPAPGVPREPAAEARQQSVGSQSGGFLVAANGPADARDGGVSGTVSEPATDSGGAGAVTGPGSAPGDDALGAVRRGAETTPPGPGPAVGPTGRAAAAGPALAATTTGGGVGVGAEYGPYLTALRQRIQHLLRYPASARRRGVSGTVNVEILILANGTVGDVTVLDSSSHSVLDDAALDTIRALPRMPLPPELPARPLRVRVPVVFQLR